MTETELEYTFTVEDRLLIALLKPERWSREKFAYFDAFQQKIAISDEEKKERNMRIVNKDLKWDDDSALTVMITHNEMTTFKEFLQTLDRQENLPEFCKGIFDKFVLSK